MKLETLNIMWDELSGIPINDNDEIESNFYHWEKGTYRFDIWH